MKKFLTPELLFRILDLPVNNSFVIPLIVSVLMLGWSVITRLKLDFMV